MSPKVPGTNGAPMATPTHSPNCTLNTLTFGENNMPRYARTYSQTGIYHVIMRGNNKQAIFHDNKDKKVFIKLLKAHKAKKNFMLYAFCLMDNHVHLLIGDKNNRLSDIMHGLNGAYANYFNREYKKVGHLFQDRFRSENIENDTYLFAVIRYIHQNPRKAGMVDKIGDYKWSSFNDYMGSGDKSGLTDIEFVLAMFSEEHATAVKSFRKFNELIEDKAFLDVSTDDERTQDGMRMWNKKRRQGIPQEKIIKIMSEQLKLSARIIEKITKVNRKQIAKILKSTLQK
jgi:REP element-mobilizing transposase RayT